MFQRINYEDWQVLFPIIGFAIFFLIFLVAVIWIMRMKKEKVDRMGQMPLDDDSEQVKAHGKRTK
jgi:cbb3-type cytochrome oxidase subunit 3